MSHAVWVASLLLVVGCQSLGPNEPRPTTPPIVVERGEVIVFDDGDDAEGLLAESHRSKVGPGTHALVEWSGLFYPAVVVAVIDEAHLKISYTGWGSEWDEVVTLDRVVAGTRLDGSPFGAKGRPPATTYAIESARVGDAVEVEWGGSWWPARVLEVVPEGVKIRYDGYGQEWDEVVGQARVRRSELQTL